jgi:hypothetical protein
MAVRAPRLSMAAMAVVVKIRICSPYGFSSAPDPMTCAARPCWSNCTGFLNGRWVAASPGVHRLFIPVNAPGR